MNNRALKIVFRQGERLYSFSEISFGRDGSAYIFFPNIPKARGIGHSLSMTRKDTPEIAFSPQIIADFQFETNDNEKFRISYHTTGLVVYHGQHFPKLFLEPLCDITKKNYFFIFSFQKLDKFQSINLLENDQDPKVIFDISMLVDMRIDMCFSVVPISFTNTSQDFNTVLIAHANVYQIFIELFTDKETFNFSEIYSPSDCVKIKPRNNNSMQNALSKSNAILRYKHILFQTDDLLILPPNSIGEIEIIFTVVMRIPPWIKIEFQNPDYEVIVVDRKDWCAHFKVYDRVHSRFVKDAQDIIITGGSLDAEIYDDNETPPFGYI